MGGDCTIKYEQIEIIVKIDFIYIYSNEIDSPSYYKHIPMSK